MRPSEGSPKTPPTKRAPFASRASVSVGWANTAASRALQCAACDSANMSAPIPSVPSDTRSPSASTSALPTELFMFERVLCAIVVPDSTTMRSSEGERYTQCARRASFVNAPGTPDPTISFKVEREQKVPVLLGVPEVVSR